MIAGTEIRGSPDNDRKVSVGSPSVGAAKSLLVENLENRNFSSIWGLGSNAAAAAEILRKWWISFRCGACQ